MANEKITITTRNTYKEGVRSIEPIELNTVLSQPDGDEPMGLTKEDVWGNRDDKGNLIDRGMVVARTNKEI